MQSTCFKDIKSALYSINLCEKPDSLYYSSKVRISAMLQISVLNFGGASLFSVVSFIPVVFPLIHF